MYDYESNPEAKGVEYQVTTVDPTDPETKGKVYQVHKVTEEVAATMAGKIYRARIIKDPTEPTVIGKVYQVVFIDDPDDPSVKGKVYNAIVIGGSQAVVIGPAVPPLVLPDAIEGDIVSLKAFGGCEQVDPLDPTATPTPDNPIDIVCNNGVLKARHQSGLPLGYTLLDYIETDGNSYIDTNLLLSNTSEFEITFQSADAILNTSIMGAISGGTSFTSTNNLCVTYTVTPGLNAYSVYCNGAAGNINESWNAGDAQDKLKHTVKYNGLNIAPTLDGVDMEQLVPTTLIANTPTVTTWLFGRNNTGSGTKTQTGVRIYDFKVVGIAHFVPCKNASNVVGMYDLVSGQFFTNAGTGDFVAGSTVSDPVEIYADGTVETIVVTHNEFDPTDTSAQFSGFIRNVAVGEATRLVEYSGGDKCLIFPVKAGDTYKFTRPTNVGVKYDRIRVAASVGRPAPSVTNNMLMVFNLTGDPTPPSATFTIPEGYDYIAITVRNTGVVGTDWQTFLDGVSFCNLSESSATAEMLLSIGDYTDEQEIIDGTVTRKVGVKVLDGTEDWYWSDPLTSMFCVYSIAEPTTDRSVLCNQFRTQSYVPAYRDGYCVKSAEGYIGIGYDMLNGDVTAFKAYLAQQYTAGTPVIVVYPLATSTTETVTGQDMEIVDGDNTVEITQASMDGLELEVTYNAAVSLTIQEVQDANLDPNVQVTIN